LTLTGARAGLTADGRGALSGAQRVIGAAGTAGRAGAGLRPARADFVVALAIDTELGWASDDLGALAMGAARAAGLPGMSLAGLAPPDATLPGLLAFTATRAFEADLLGDFRSVVGMSIA